MKRIAACVLLGLACSDAAAASARCHIIYGGEEWTIDAAPTAQPYRVEGKKIGRYFEFKLVYADQPATGKSIRVYTHGMSSGDPVLIQIGFTRFALRLAEAARVSVRTGVAA